MWGKNTSLGTKPMESHARKKVNVWCAFKCNNQVLPNELNLSDVYQRINNMWIWVFLLNPPRILYFILVIYLCIGYTLKLYKGSINFVTESSDPPLVSNNDNNNKNNSNYNLLNSLCAFRDFLKHIFLS